MTRRKAKAADSPATARTSPELQTPAVIRCWQRRSSIVFWSNQTRETTTDDKVGEAVRQVTDAHRDSVAKADSPKTEKLEKAGKMEHIDRPMRPERPGR